MAPATTRADVERHEDAGRFTTGPPDAGTGPNRSRPRRRDELGVGAREEVGGGGGGGGAKRRRLLLRLADREAEMKERGARREQAAKEKGRNHASSLGHTAGLRGAAHACWLWAVDARGRGRTVGMVLRG